MASFVGWKPINSGLIETGSDVLRVTMADQELVESLGSYIENNPDFDFLFVQLDEPDGVGHSHGFDSKEQHAAIHRADRQTLSIHGALERQGLLDDALLILVSDHGGGGRDPKNHSSDHPRDMTIFWGCVGRGSMAGSGSGVRTPVHLKDTPAVCARALGLAAPSGWDGRVPAILDGSTVAD